MSSNQATFSAELIIIQILGKKWKTARLALPRNQPKCQTIHLTTTGVVDMQIDAPHMKIFDDFGDF